jgi:hypothetical protein
MRFSKPISREVEVDGNTFVVTFSDLGLEFRLKGKRRTARAEWIEVLSVAKGDQGESAQELLGIEAGASTQREAEPQGRAFGQTAGSSHDAGTGTGNQSGDTGEELGRAVTAGEVGPES